MSQLAANARYFQAYDGSLVVIEGSFANRIFLGNKSTLYEVKGTGFGGSSIKAHIGYENPHQNNKGDINLDGTEVTHGGKVYREVGTLKIKKIVPLPNVRQPEYLFKLQDGTVIYVSADKYNYTYESFRLFMGKRGQLKLVRIFSVDRYRDGGTTNISTEKGLLHSPSAFRSSEVATWQEQPLEKLDPSAYVIKESEIEVTIKKA